MISFLICFIVVWLIWCWVCDIIIFKFPYPTWVYKTITSMLPLPEVHYIWIKKADKEPLGWVWSWYKLSLVRLKNERINEFKFFWDNK